MGLNLSGMHFSQRDDGLRRVLFQQRFIHEGLLHFRWHTNSLLRAQLLRLGATHSFSGVFGEAVEEIATAGSVADGLACSDEPGGLVSVSLASSRVFCS